MRAFLTVLSGSLRLLRARKIFWVTLVITVVLGLLYMSVGFNEKGITYLFGLGTLENEIIYEGSDFAEAFYLLIFSLVIVNYWLSWVAVILAMISCGPIFPGFMEGGDSGVVLAKPPSRLALFFYKYIGGLLFMALQTLIFCLIVFVALKWRIGSWNPSVFWAVPLLVLLFSYLWSIMIAVGVKTKSTLASILCALLVWFACWVSKAVEEFSWSAAELGEVPGAFGQPMKLSEEDQEKWKARYPTASLSYKLLPKTSDTTALLIRKLKVGSGESLELGAILGQALGGNMDADEEAAIDEAMGRNSIVWIIGSSLAFEAVVLGIGAWMFCRRDF
ncbi:MAG: hypothetical protein AAGI48_16170 [Verrucomicrobiota bacterium]